MIEDFRLKVFIAVSQTHSFTKAARLLDITQPAVSQNIAELEKKVNAELFNRTRGEVTLTEKGEVFKAFAEKIIKNYEDLNAVFSNYEAFESIIEQSRSISENPLYYLAKEILLR